MDAHRTGGRARAGDRGGRIFLPNLVAARLDRADQDTAFSLSTGDEQGPATVLRRKLTDGMQNLFYGAEDPVELDESAAAHTLAEITQYAQDLLGALEKDSALFGGGFSVEEGATVQYASYGSGFVLWGIALSNPRGDTASFLLDDATGCVLALSYTFSDSYAFQIRQNDLWDYLLCVFENRVGATVAAALGVPYDEVQIPMPEAAKKNARSARKRWKHRSPAAAQRRKRGQLQRRHGQQHHRLPAVL